MEILDEVTTIVLSYTLFCFSPANILGSSETEYDMAFVAVIGANVLVHVGLLFWDSFKSIKAKIKQKCCKKKNMASQEA